jgi:hypothetical protein
MSATVAGAATADRAGEDLAGSVAPIGTISRSSGSRSCTGNTTCQRARTGSTTSTITANTQPSADNHALPD